MCSHQVNDFASVKCDKHDTYRCKRTDGKQAESGGTGCSWIENNKMDCQLKTVKPTKSPKPTDCPNKAAVQNRSNVNVRLRSLTFHRLLVSEMIITSVENRMAKMFHSVLIIVTGSV